jgi:hypothetical protein
MFPFLRSQPKDDAPARVALDRAVAVLRSCQRSGLTAVPVTDVLEMLGAGPGAVPPPGAAPRAPGTDPLTGTRWAGPPGSAPPGS